MKTKLKKKKKKFNGCIGPVQMDVLAEMGMGIH